MTRPEEQNKASAELAPVLDILAGAFESGLEGSLQRLYVFDPLKHEDRTWGFVILTAVGGDGRLELAAFSYEVDASGAVTRRQESRRAMLPPERLEDVVEGIVLRLDEPDCAYRVIDLAGHGGRAEQLDYLRNMLSGETDGDSGEQRQLRLQPGDSGANPGSAGDS